MEGFDLMRVGLEKRMEEAAEANSAQILELLAHDQKQQDDISTLENEIVGLKNEIVGLKEENVGLKNTIVDFERRLSALEDDKK